MAAGKTNSKLFAATE